MAPVTAERCERCGMLPHAHVPIEFATDNDDEPTLYVSPNLDGYCPPETGTVQS